MPGMRRTSGQGEKGSLTPECLNGVCAGYGTDAGSIQCRSGGCASSSILPYGETLASEMHAWGHALPGAVEPDKSLGGEWIAGVDHLIDENFLEGRGGLLARQHRHDGTLPADEDPMQVGEIAEFLSVTRERVRRIARIRPSRIWSRPSRTAAGIARRRAVG